MSTTETLPLADQLMQDSTVSHWWGTIAPAFRRLQGIPQQLATLLQDLHTTVSLANLDPNLSTKGKGDKETAARQAALAAIDGLQRGAEGEYAWLAGQAEQALARPKGDLQQQVLDELQLQRAWSRIVRRLDGVPDGEFVRMRQTIDGLLETAATSDRAILDAARAEVPTYLEARGMTQLYNQGIGQRIDELEAPFLQPVGRAALQIRNQLAAGWPRVLAGLGAARADVSGGTAIIMLPGWSPTERFVIERGGTR